MSLFNRECHRQGKKHAGVNWDELNLCWSLSDEAGPGGAGGTVAIKEFFSDFPEDLEMKVKRIAYPQYMSSFQPYSADSQSRMGRFEVMEPSKNCAHLLVGVRGSARRREIWA